jgi:PII-like signaling protein
MTMAVCIRFYLHEGRQHGHLLLRDWLFETARTCGIPGGTALRAVAGFGRHGLHEDHFFELAGDLPELVEFFAEADRIQTLLARLEQAGLALLHVSHEVSVGMTHPTPPN